MWPREQRRESAIMKRPGIILLAAVLAMAAVAWGQDTARPEAWDTSLALGVHVTDGNSRTLLGSARLASQREVAEHTLRLGLEGVYGENTVANELGEEESQVTAESAKASASYRYALSGTYFYGDSAVLHDDTADVEYRATVGVGLGYSVVKTDNASVGVEGGAGYLWEDVADLTDNYVTLRVAVISERRLSKTAKVWESVEYVPRADDLDDYLLAGEIGVEAAVDSSLSLRVVVQDRYDSTPAAGREENDVAVISSLSWQL